MRKKNNTMERTNTELIEGLLKIRDKRKQLVKFKLNRAQQLYMQKRTRRNLILKARQEGISKVIDADQLIDCVRKPTNAVVVSHEKEATKRLFAAVRAFIDTMQVKPAVSIDSKSEIQFPKRPSNYFVGTAGQKAAGRGDTIERAHLSEAAFYPDLKRILDGVAEAAEYGQIDIETTPNGREEFYDMWQKAKKGYSSYTPIFIPWFINREYNVDNLTEKEKAGLSVSVREMIAMPDAEFIATLSQEEKRFAAKVAEEYQIVLTAGELKWRRYKIWDRGAMFFQEYPEDDVSCFLQSGRSVFSHVVTDQTKRIPLDSLEKWGTEEDRKALINRVLYAGIDGAEGTLGGDSHVFAVVDVRPLEGKAYVIYELHSNEPIDVFAEKVKKVCQALPRLQLAVEKNGVGTAHVQQLRRLAVRFTEWDTNGSTRPVMLTDLEEAYRKEELIETYLDAENEARDMFYSSTNRPEHPSGKHDDRVFARAIAWQMRKRPAPGISWV